VKRDKEMTVDNLGGIKPYDMTKWAELYGGNVSAEQRAEKHRAMREALVVYPGSATCRTTLPCVKPIYVGLWSPSSSTGARRSSSCCQAATEDVRAGH